MLADTGLLRCAAINTAGRDKMHTGANQKEIVSSDQQRYRETTTSPQQPFPGPDPVMHVTQIDPVPINNPAQAADAWPAHTHLGAGDTGFLDKPPVGAREQKQMLKCVGRLLHEKTYGRFHSTTPAMQHVENPRRTHSGHLRQKTIHLPTRGRSWQPEERSASAAIPCAPHRGAATMSGPNHVRLRLEPTLIRSSQAATSTPSREPNHPRPNPTSARAP